MYQKQFIHVCVKMCDKEFSYVLLYIFQKQRYENKGCGFLYLVKSQLHLLLYFVVHSASPHCIIVLSNCHLLLIAL